MMFHVKQFEQLTTFAENQGFTLHEEELKQFELLRSALLEKNKVMNLTAITDPDEVEIKHFVDSLLAAPVIQKLWQRTCSEQNVSEPVTADYRTCSENVGTAKSAPSTATFRLIDVGCGAGFPGLPLKIVFPQAQFLLMDSLNKRIEFVKETAALLSLQNLDAVAARAEDLAKAGSVSRETFDFCVSRAVADMSVLAEYCLPFVKTGGYCIFYKSGAYEEELENARPAIEVLGGTVEKIEDLTLPVTGDARSLLILRKIKATPDKYPRRPGKPSKSPIR